MTQMALELQQGFGDRVGPMGFVIQDRGKTMTTGLSVSAVVGLPDSVFRDQESPRRECQEGLLRLRYL